MVLASMCGSRVSNEYGSGGRVKATGFSSECEFGLGFFVSASKRSGTAPPAPTNPAPTMLVPTINLRRLMATSSDALARVGVRADYTAIQRLVVNLRSPSNRIKIFEQSPFRLSLDAGKRPKGGFGDDRVFRRRKALQQSADPSISGCFAVEVGIAQRDASVANQASPLGSLHSAALKEAAEFRFVHFRQPLESRQKQRFLGRFRSLLLSGLREAL